MARKLHKLSARTVATVMTPGRHSDGGGLYLFISRDNAVVRRRWVFRFVWQGKTHEMGLGGLVDITLAEARRRAADARNYIAAGRSPIEARDAAKQAQNPPTFGEIAMALIASKEGGWRSLMHRQQWRQTLET